MTTEFNTTENTSNNTSKPHVTIYHLLDGARQAKGLTVIIDVFRAFTVECFLSQMHVRNIFTVGTIEECLALKAEHPDYYLVGERRGRKIEGFDVGNSPSQIVTGPLLEGRDIVHTTSAGVQGVTLATGADEIITGSLVNAKAIARYIRARNPQEVSLVCMGLGGMETTAEDELCATYLKALIEGENPNIHDEITDLSRTTGAKFFEVERRGYFPQPDFFMCLVPNIFNFVLRINTESYPLRVERIDV